MLSHKNVLTNIDLYSFFQHRFKYGIRVLLPKPTMVLKQLARCKNKKIRQQKPLVLNNFQCIFHPSVLLLSTLKDIIAQTNSKYFFLCRSFPRKEQVFFIWIDSTSHFKTMFCSQHLFKASLRDFQLSKHCKSN